MDTLSYKTKSINKENANKQWLLVDAEGISLGRVASVVATRLRGKHKTCYTPHADCGDNVVLINAEKVNLSGDKWDSKVYLRHTGYPGGQRETTAREMMAKKPTEMVRKAVKGMLPKGKLGRAIFKNLFVYEGSSHEQEAQKPEVLDIKALI